jgi:hypothetical protein
MLLIGFLVTELQLIMMAKGWRSGDLHRDGNSQPSGHNSNRTGDIWHGM